MKYLPEHKLQKEKFAVYLDKNELLVMSRINYDSEKEFGNICIEFNKITHMYKSNEYGPIEVLYNKENTPARIFDSPEEALMFYNEISNYDEDISTLQNQIKKIMGTRKLAFN